MGTLLNPYLNFRGTTREAMQFGRRPVKLTVLSYPRRKAAMTRARVVNPSATTAATADSANKQQK